MPIQSTIERGRETMYNVSGQFAAGAAKGGYMQRIAYPCEDCGRTGVLHIIWRIGVYHCPSCGCYKIGTVLCVDKVEMDKEVTDETERTN